MAGLVDEALNRHAPDDHMGMLDSLGALDPARLDPQDLEALHQARALLRRALGDTDGALEALAEGLETFPESGRLHFARGRFLEEERRVDEAFDALARVRLAGVGGDFVLAVARYAYLWDRPDVAQPVLDEIMGAYRDLRIIDDHFLYMRGLPFFSVTFGYIATFARMRGDHDAPHAALEEARGFSDGHLDGMEELLGRFLTGDAAALRAHLADVDFAAHQATGHRDMSVALIDARASASLADAHAALDGVTLGEADWPWLEDVRTLGKGEASLRLEDAAGAQSSLGDFVRAQPMLFEPNHVFSFDLFDVQEGLKGGYREG